jgi:hypothetical protein
MTKKFGFGVRGFFQVRTRSNAELNLNSGSGSRFGRCPNRTLPALDPALKYARARQCMGSNELNGFTAWIVQHSYGLSMSGRWNELEALDAANVLLLFAK